MRLSGDVAPAPKTDVQSMPRRVSALVCVVGILAAAVALVPATAAPSTRQPQATRVTLSALESGVLQELNAIRREHGLVPLKINARLTAASVQHSRDMVARGYFKHESADGSAFWKRVQRYYAQGRYGYWSVGENLLWSSPDVDPSRALELWMESPEHRANILTAKWREIGISAVHAQAAPGTYNGLEVTVITTDFGTRH
jgi:uncharacterized protein YkwD